MKLGWQHPPTWLVPALVLGLPAAPAQAQASDPRDTPYWELIGGFEGDTHGTGYGFFGPSYNHPLSRTLAFTARVYANYLYYEFEDVDGTHDVRSPGISPAVGLRFGEDNTVKVTAGLSVKRRREEVTSLQGLSTEDSETRVGASFGLDVNADPTDNTNLLGLLHYSTTDDYIWGRLGLKRQVSNMDWKGRHTLYLGVEGVGQGNEDIRSWQVGGLVELLFAPSRLSLQFRSGYKQSSFDLGPDKTGPYFGVGLYKRF